MHDFPHMSDTAFPNVANVDVYRYRNEYDYNLWTADTRLTLCNVPWCGDYENVVKFDDDAARDAWFDGLAGETQRLSTMIHVKPDSDIKLPFPISTMQRYNYLVVDLPVPPVPDGRDLPRKSRYFYFIESAYQSSPSATLCSIQLDMWTTYINDMTFDYIMLKRGHAPMAACDADRYLANPRANSRYLLCPDYTTGAPERVSAHAEKVWNAGDMWFCVVTYANARDAAAWGNGDAPKVPGIAAPYTQGTGPVPDCWGVDAGRWRDLLDAIEQTRPWLLQAIMGCFYVAKDLTAPDPEPTTICGVPAYHLNASQRVLDVARLNKDSFGYDPAYADQAKLYTYPYAALSVATDAGDVTTVRVEDTDGTVSVSASLSLAWPYIAIDAHLVDVGGVGEDVSFSVPGGRACRLGGRWFETLKSWHVAIFAAPQPGATYAGYTTVYTRQHEELAAVNANASALASNATAYSNATASNATAQTNADNSAANITANNAVTVAMNDSVVATQNDAATKGTHNTNVLQTALKESDQLTMSAAYSANLAGLAVASVNNNVSAVAGAGAALISGIGSAAAGGNVASGLLSGVGGVVNAAVGWSTSNNSLTVSESNSKAIYENAIAASNAKTNNTNAINNGSNIIQINARNAINAATNAASTSIAANNAGVITTNAANTRATGDANAERTKTTGDANAARTLATARDGIVKGLAQRGAVAPVTFGTLSGIDHSVTRPQVLSVSVMTQRLGDIQAAASQFARYGYTLDQQWQMTSMQVMRHFTYWQCSEVWCVGNGNALEQAQQAVKDIMRAGVTVWSVPEEIGRVNIYDN